MTTQAKETKKPLTVKQYEFYKTKENPMTDAQIMKIHGLNANSLNSWKKENNLVGKNYGLQGKALVKVVKIHEEEPTSLQEKRTVAPKLYENKQVKERLNGYKVESEKEETQPDTHERYETLGSLSVGEPPVEVTAQLADKKINMSNFGGWDEAPKQMERIEIPESLLLKQENEKLKAHIASLEDRHVEESQLIDELRRDVKDANKERYVEIERGDEWRTKARNFENELNKVKESHTIQVSNLKGEISRLDQALQLHAEDETLLFLTMQKAMQMRSRLTESAEEGGRSTWI